MVLAKYLCAKRSVRRRPPGRHLPELPPAGLCPGTPSTRSSPAGAGWGVEGEPMQTIYGHYMAEFGLDDPVNGSLLIYLQNILHGDLGAGFFAVSGQGRTADRQAIPVSIAIQLPAVSRRLACGRHPRCATAYKAGWLRQRRLHRLAVPHVDALYCLAILCVCSQSRSRSFLPEAVTRSG